MHLKLTLDHKNIRKSVFFFVRCPSCLYIFISQQRAVISYLRRPEFRPKSCNLFLCISYFQTDRCYKMISTAHYQPSKKNIYLCILKCMNRSIYFIILYLMTVRLIALLHIPGEGISIWLTPCYLDQQC